MDALASLYVARDEPTFWAWVDDGRAVAWALGPADGADPGEPGGRLVTAPGPTIAFVPELATILRLVAADGLPSLPAVLLLLGACRDGWLEAADASFSRVVAAAADDEDGPRRLLPSLSRALEALLAVGRLPQELRAGPEAKAALVAEVLARARRRVFAADAPHVLAALDTGVAPATAVCGLGALDALVADLQAVTAGLAAPGSDLALAEAVRRRRATGLPALPAPAPVPPPPPPGGAGPADEAPELPCAEHVRRLLRALEGDAELGGVARLAQALRAAVHVPRPVERDDELPLGGVSDITNRGPLDRLLVSELAHDELTFAVRVATGEALYLRREAPPRAPAGGRAVLVDVGVRLWGTPRRVAAAVALALAATAGKRPVRAWRAQGPGLLEVDLRTREGLERLLGRLEADPHPGPRLAPFLAAADAEGDAVDVVLVTHEDALHDPALRAALAAARPALARRALLVATVDAEGAYRLRAVTARGQRLLSEARLDVPALLAPRAGARAKAPAVGWRPPLILGLPVLPLRLPHAFDPARTRLHPAHGAVAVTRDGRLLHWSTPGLGGRQVAGDLPLRPLQHLSVDDRGEVVVVVGPHDGALTAVRADLTAGAAARVVVPCLAPPLAVLRDGGALLLVHPRHVEAASLATGQPGAALPLPAGTTWRAGRFFTGPGGWAALGADGLAPRLDALPFGDDVGLVWDRRGLGALDGPWALADDGTIRASAGGDPLALGAVRAGAAWASQDGDRLLAHTMQGTALLDLRTGERRTVNARFLEVPARRALHLEPGLARLFSGLPQVRTRLLGLAVDGHGRLAVVSRKRRVHALTRSPVDDLELVPAQGVRLRAWRAFDGVAEGAAPGAPPWRAASWPDGSRAVVDGRGLLHLQPRTGPEVTLVLAEGPVAAWSSDGLLVGPRFFTGEAGPPAPGAVARVLEHVGAFCAGIR